MYDKNRSFFENENLLSSYWAGYIGADGSLNKNYSKFTLRICLNDIEHLTKFVKDVDYSGKIRCDSKMATVEICSVKEWYEDLERLYNITPVKTYTLIEPKIIQFENKLAYSLGLLDGDGCVGKSGKYLYLRWHGTERVVNWVKQQVDHLVPNNNQVRKHSENLWVFQITGKKAVSFIEKIPKDLLLLTMKRKIRRIDD